ncbi:Ribonuclease T2 domain containing protein-like protein [Leptotrombidium deliense]|uniref:Ribonuclease T2 domain containing protein-like protein n=1 Tax=Leptotrombidium deliense TaxID=299467 RepID=A0A443S9L9_9ACAR|nr:Ribonuclease T2 domain containing protein-like protein [Leptotrombidium deliense]
MYYSQTANGVTDGNSTEPICKPTQFDNYVFATRWPPSVCINQQCANATENWVIHGLWPNYKNDSWPQFCCKKWHFNVDNISSIVPQMENVWPNLETGKAYYSLWKHEWLKHGTCTYGQYNSELDYFDAALQVNSKYTIEQYLENAGIKPTDTAQNPVNTSMIHTALESKLNKKVHLECTNVKKEISPYPLLTTIFVCLDKQNLEPIDCTQKEAGCSDQLIIPSLKFPH